MKLKKAAMAGAAATAAATAVVLPAEVAHASASGVFNFRCQGEVGEHAAALRVEGFMDRASVDTICLGGSTLRARAKYVTRENRYYFRDTGNVANTHFVNAYGTPGDNASSVCFWALDREGYWFNGQIMGDNSVVWNSCNLY
jgi:hypothetical protein